VTQELEIRINESGQTVTGLLDNPGSAKWLYVYAHGAGAGMRHHFMTSLTERLVDRQVAVLRFNFPYMEQEKRRPDHRNLLVQTVKATVQKAEETLPLLPIFAGGRSMGGRMASQCCAENELTVSGLIFVGFPLHPAGKEGTKRADHLRDIPRPMLFLQGTRDKLANLELLRPVVDSLEQGTLHVVEGGDHGFTVLKRSGRTNEQVLDELADTACEWVAAKL
jgi:predicted alpha/beta-hydrolase family hydrolase